MPEHLVTGVAGFIGSSIARALVARGDKVRGIDNFSTGRRENLKGLEAINLIEGDLNDPGLAERACRQIDLIFHEAALPSVPRSVEDPVGSNRANVDATVKLLDAARNCGVKRVIYAGSSSAYGNSPLLPKREDMLPAPLSPYAVSKLAGEHYMSAFHRVYGLETVTLRYFNVFGPHQDPTSQYSGVLAVFIAKMLRNHTPTIYGDGEQSRDFTYIDNVVAGNLLAAAAGAERVAGRVFNVATGMRITLNETAELLRGLSGYRGEIAYGPERQGDVKHSLADISTAKSQFGYEPKVLFPEGLRKTVAWYRARSEVASASR
ncbi:MAG TPA: SDR family oxidoreductase [Candidatus Angelobacter sp.]|nr:SDR family oxidoreductase [Candidatus Angelobacter sp.]